MTRKCATAHNGRLEKNFDPLRGFVGGGFRRARWVGRVAAVALVASVAACAGTSLAPADTRRQDPVRATDYDTDGGSGTVFEVPVTLSNGQVVVCLINDQGYGGGMSCDFARAAR